MTHDPLLMRAARGEKVERVPVWAMRQAGRWDPEFNRLRAGLGFYAFSENVDLAIRCSLLPRRFGVDAIILFYDITTLTVSMGLPFTLEPGKGPVPGKQVKTLEDVERLLDHPPVASYDHIVKLLRGVLKELNGALPVLVFAGAPFTVATYCIGTGKDLQATRTFAQENTQVWDALLKKIEIATVDFLNTLIAEGASAYQLFDSWAGQLERPDYLRWAQPYHQRILAQAAGTPRILFVKECPYLDYLTASGAEIISLGQCHDLAQARRDYPNLIFQGNVDEEILRDGNEAQVVEATRRCLAAGGGHRHILNLNHGCDRAMPVANFEAYVRTAKEWAV